jgi:hypothetical protein
MGLKFFKEFKIFESTKVESSVSTIVDNRRKKLRDLCLNNLKEYVDTDEYSVDILTRDYVDGDKGEIHLIDEVIISGGLEKPIDELSNKPFVKLIKTLRNKLGENNVVVLNSGLGLGLLRGRNFYVGRMLSANFYIADKADEQDVYFQKGTVFIDTSKGLKENNDKSVAVVVKYGVIPTDNNCLINLANITSAPEAEFIVKKDGTSEVVAFNIIKSYLYKLCFDEVVSDFIIDPVKNVDKFIELSKIDYSDCRLKYAIFICQKYFNVDSDTFFKISFPYQKTEVYKYIQLNYKKEIDAYLSARLKLRHELLIDEADTILLSKGIKIPKNTPIDTKIIVPFDRKLIAEHLLKRFNYMEDADITYLQILESNITKLDWWSSESFSQRGKPEEQRIPDVDIANYISKDNSGIISLLSEYMKIEPIANIQYLDSDI